MRDREQALERNYLWWGFTLLGAMAGMFTLANYVFSKVALSTNFPLIGIAALISSIIVGFTAITTQNTQGAQNTMDKWRNMHWGWKAAMGFLMLLCFFAILSPTILPLLGVSVETLMTPTLLDMSLAETILGAGLIGTTLFSILHLVHVQYLPEPQVPPQVFELSPDAQRPSHEHVLLLQENNGIGALSTPPTPATPTLPKKIIKRGFANTGKTKEELIAKIEEMVGIKPDSILLVKKMTKANEVVEVITIRFLSQHQDALTQCHNLFRPYMDSNIRYPIKTFVGPLVGIEVQLEVFQRALKENFTPTPPPSFFPSIPGSPI